MNEKINPATNGDERAPLCERAFELVACLYGEASASEEKSFRQHLETCALCREEFANFGVVRQAVGLWRAEALRIEPSQVLEGAAAPQIAAASIRPAGKRSALSALREFLALSPVWLRGGALAATVIICALAALVFARTEIRWDASGVSIRAGVEGERVVTRTVEVPVKNSFTRQQVDEMIKGEVARARDEMEARFAASDAAREPVIVNTGGGTNGARSRASSNAASRRAVKNAGRPNTGKTPRGSNQVAGFEEEERATSLYDLLRVIN